MFQNFRSYQLAVQFYHQCKTLKLNTNLKDQLERATSSIVLNLAEGSGKYHYPAEAKRFFRIALGSLRESQAILDLQIEKNSEIKTLANRLGGNLYKLCL